MTKLKKREISDIELLFDLLASFKSLNSPKEISSLLSDLLTANEIRNISVRLRIAKLLLAGMHQRDIVTTTGSSLGTVNKVSIWLSEGGNGFRYAISRLPIKWKKPKKLARPIEYHLPELLLATGKYLLAEAQNIEPRKMTERMKRKEVIEKEVKEFNWELYSRK